MNIRADLSLVPAPAVLPATMPRLVGARIVPLADGVAALIFDETAPAPGRQRLDALIDGRPLRRAAVATELDLRCGGRRRVLMIGTGADDLARRYVTLTLAGRPAALADPGWLQPPVVEPTALIDGLADAGRRRLLKLLLTTGASLFGPGGCDGFARAVHQLLDLTGVRAAEPASWCRLGSRARVLSYLLPAGTADPGVTELIALGADRFARIAGVEIRLERLARGVALHVHLPVAVPAGAELVGLGEVPVLLRAPGAEAVPRPLVPWLSRREASVGRWLRERNAAEAEGDPAAAVLAAELRHAATPPELRLCHLSATPKGVLHALEIEDPNGLVRALRLERGGAALDLPLPEAAVRTRRTVLLAGFAPLARARGLDDTARLRLVYRSGRVQTVQAGPLAQYSGEVPARFTAAPAAVAAARLSAERAPTGCRVTTIGSESAAPRLALVIDAAGGPDLLRARAAMLHRERGAGRVELVHHLADGPAAETVLRTLCEIEVTFGLATTVVTLAEGAWPSERLRAALGAVRAEAALVLGAEVLPAQPGWLQIWLRALVGPRAPHVMGATLLGPLGGVIAAGGGFEGLPEGDLPRGRSRAGSRFAAECFGLTRRGIDRIGGLTAYYPDPDILLAETVRRLRGEGHVVRTLLQARFVRYAEPRPIDRLEAAVDAAALEALAR